jgi:polyvinyl alcohol dehydrogenase (cytochrome)
MRHRRATAAARRAVQLLTISAVLAAAPVVVADSATPQSSGNWPMWQRDLNGSRHNAGETTITTSNVANLRLKWSFVFPFNDGAHSSQPAVVDGTVYVGGRNNRFYAIDARTGRQRWVYDVTAVAGLALDKPNPLRNGPAVADGRVFFGDSRGWMYALDTSTGRLVWSKRLSDHPGALMTSSPIVHDGRLFVGVSSREEELAEFDTYGCCTFRGSLVALDTRTGNELWRHYTVPPPQPSYVNYLGVQQYAPSGNAVWGSPVVDASSNTVYVATGNNYTGNEGDTDSVLALDTRTGVVRWAQQMTDVDAWTAQCVFPLPGGNCPEPGPDFDFGATPNLFRVNGRLLVGIGQKSGIFHTFDARTGTIVWQAQVTPAGGVGGPGAQTGLQWGSSYDGQRIYVATNDASPGVLHALDPATGALLWATPNPADGCTTGGATNLLFARPGECRLAHTPAPSSSPGLVFEGSRDGKIRAYGSGNGTILWQYDTTRSYFGTNLLLGNGGSVSGNGGAVIANGMVFVGSGYHTANVPGTGIRGSVLLAFGL